MIITVGFAFLRLDELHELLGTANEFSFIVSFNSYDLDFAVL